MPILPSEGQYDAVVRVLDTLAAQAAASAVAQAVTHDLLAGAGAAVAGGAVPGTFDVHKFGIIRNVGATPVDVWSYGGLYPWQSAPVALEVVSSSADDTALGSGARTIDVEVLDAQLNPFVRTVALNGLTPVAIEDGVNWLRHNRGFVTSVGAYHGVNVGDIHVRLAGGGAVIGEIPASRGQTLQSIYTVPRGFKAYLKRLTFVVEGNKTADVQLYHMPDAANTSTFSSVRVVHEMPDHSEHGLGALKSWVAFDEMTDIWAAALPDGVGTTLWADYDLQLVAI